MIKVIINAIWNSIFDLYSLFFISTVYNFLYEIVGKIRDSIKHLFDQGTMNNYTSSCLNQSPFKWKIKSPLKSSFSPVICFKCFPYLTEKKFGKIVIMKAYSA
jgi:hypothetical protein